MVAETVVETHAEIISARFYATIFLIWLGEKRLVVDCAIIDAVGQIRAN